MKLPKNLIRLWPKPRLTGRINASELFPDPEERAKIKHIIDLFNGTLVGIYERKKRIKK